MKKSLILILLLFCNCGFSKNFIKPIKDASWKVISNKHAQKWGSTALFIYGQGICNAKIDGYTWDNLYGDGRVYGINKNNWHYWKTQERLSTWFSVALKSLAVGQKNMTLKEAIVRTGSESLIAWSIWHPVYYHTRYGNYWDTSHAGHILYYPDIIHFKDNFIGMKGNQVYAFHGIRMGLGLSGLIYSEYKW